MWLKLIGLVVPLGLDTFAVAAALGMAGLSPRDRTRVSVIFTAFEAGMPLIGFLAGNLAGAAVGNAADYLAIAILIGLGVSISIDELAIGFTIGLLHFPVLVILVLIGIQTFVLTQLGIRLGQRIGERIREVAERLAGAALALLGGVLLAQKLFH